MPMNKTKRLKMKAQRKGYRAGERSMALTREQLNQSLSVVIAEINGEEEGKELSMSNTENLTMLDKANLAFYKWSKDNDISLTNTQPETFKLMEEAFVDGYLKGFAKRLTEGA